MALPWLIGAVVVAVGAAAVAALSDDDNNSGGSGGDNGEEERRKARAEQERKARAHREKLEIMQADFIKEGEQFGTELRDSLKGQIKVTLVGDRAFKAKLDETETLDIISPSYVELYELHYLSQESRDNLVKFESLYDVELESEECLVQAGERLTQIDVQLTQLQALREQLNAHRREV